MSRVCSMFSQLLQFFPRLEFEQLVGEHRAERQARGFTCWGQFVALLFCQLGQAQSLREICGGLACGEGKLRHLGIPQAPQRSTLAYAKAHRPWPLDQSLFQCLSQRCRSLLGTTRRFRFHKPLLTLDSTLIDLCASLYDWATYQRTKGAAKLHLGLDHQGDLPAFAVITAGHVPELKGARRLRFEAGTILVFDRGYGDSAWYEQLTRPGVFFLTRLRHDAPYQVQENRPLPPPGPLRRDQIIRLGSPGYRRDFPRRLIEVEVPPGQEPVVWLTHHLRFAATTVARIYQNRWQVEGDVTLSV